MPSKPLRLLYRKYASQAPQGGVGNGGINVQYKYGDLLSQQHKSNSLGQLHQLGRELTELERIQMYFALTDGTESATCPSQSFSSVGSASTNGRSINSRKDLQRPGVSPSHHRSKSQEFQSKYRLALSRSSPEHKYNSTPQNHLSTVTQLPSLHQSSTNLVHESSSLIGTAENDNTQMHKQENRSVVPTIMKSSQLVSSKLPPKPAGNRVKLKSEQEAKVPHTRLRVILPKKSLANRVISNNNHQDINEKFPRCNSSSTVDADRIDSSHYQYLLEEYSSISSTTSSCSIKSDPASSYFSARAQRPSTAAGSRATQRLRDLQTGTTNATPKSRHNSYTNKSPDNQWPPRYAIIPSWPSYEDIQTLKSCGEHRNLLTQIYRRENRRGRDLNLNHKLNFWNAYTQNHPIHVVPSHTNMECTMCNLYSHKPDPTLCPPNSPLVVNHDCPDQQSRRTSTSFSLQVNQSSANHSVANASCKNHSGFNSAMSGPILKQHPLPLETSNTSASPQVMDGIPIQTNEIKSKHKLRFSGDSIRTSEAIAKQPRDARRVTYSKPSKKDVSYSWDMCKFAYVKANG